MTLERLGHQHHCQRKETLQGRKARTAGYADAALKLERRGEEHPARGWERFARGRLGLEAWMMPRGRDRGTMGRWVQKNMPTDGRNTRFPRYRVLQYGKFFPSSMSPFKGGTVPLHLAFFQGPHRVAVLWCRFPWGRRRDNTWGRRRENTCLATSASVRIPEIPGSAIGKVFSVVDVCP